MSVGRPDPPAAGRAAATPRCGNCGHVSYFAAAATPDPPTDERRPWPIAPDTVMPPRRQPVRWGSRADDPPTEIHDDPQRTKAYLAGLAAGRTEAAAASPDERLREAAIEAREFLMGYMQGESGLPFDDPYTACRNALETLDAALAAADREKPDEDQT